MRASAFWPVISRLYSTRINTATYLYSDSISMQMIVRAIFTLFFLSWLLHERQAYLRASRENERDKFVIKKNISPINLAFISVIVG